MPCLELLGRSADLSKTTFNQSRPSHSTHENLFKPFQWLSEPFRLPRAVDDEQAPLGGEGAVRVIHRVPGIDAATIRAVDDEKQARSRYIELSTL